MKQLLGRLNRIVLAGLLFSTSYSQTRPVTSPVVTPPSPVASSPAYSSPFSRSGPKAFKDVITGKAVSQTGLFTVHKVEDKYYFEIPDSLLGKEILIVNRFIRTPWGSRRYGGELAQADMTGQGNVIRFEKGPDNKMFIRSSLNVVYSGDSTKPIFQAVKNSSIEPLAASFDIKAYGRDSAGSIIEVTDFFKTDNQLVSVDQNLKRQLNLSGLASDRSYIESIRTYPINTEIKTIKTFGASGGSFGGSVNLPSAQAAGSVTLELNTSFLLLPATPMPKRLYDPRVGYLQNQVTVFTDSSQKSEDEVFITRWRLEPKAEDIEKWKRGELVEPKKPIIYYIDPATPVQWRRYLIQGINDWQKAFEQAGFKNAIHGMEWPENDTTMSLEDARFSVLRYFASDLANAYGPNISDPRSGEILESHIGWYHNVMTLLHYWYMIQAGAVDPGARKITFNNDLMGELVRIVSSHEVGHTLGLAHNYGSSSKTPVEKLGDKAWVEANGHTASIMDYARFNYVAQPEDNIGRTGILPRIGEYDKWAIEWGYKSTGAATPETDRAITNKWILERLPKNPRLWFGTETNPFDPRSQNEDLGDNSMKASEYGIKNLKRILPNLASWTYEEGDKYDNLEALYAQLVSQFVRYLGHVLKNVGGIYENPKSVEEKGDVYSITPKAIQKEAIEFFNDQLFNTPAWLLDKNVLNKFAVPSATESIFSSQAAVLRSLMSTARMGRMINSYNRDPANAYTPDEMITDLKKEIWKELAVKRPIDNYRRNLQKEFVEILMGLLPPPPSSGGGSIIISFGGQTSFDPKKTDMASIARGQLASLEKQVKAAIPLTTDKLSLYHLQDIAERIRQALHPGG